MCGSGSIIFTKCGSGSIIFLKADPDSGLQIADPAEWKSRTLPDDTDQRPFRTKTKNLKNKKKNKENLLKRMFYFIADPVSFRGSTKRRKCPWSKWENFLHLKNKSLIKSSALDSVYSSSGDCGNEKRIENCKTRWIGGSGSLRFWAFRNRIRNYLHPSFAQLEKQ
jgi:hypothetical protein